MAAFTPLDITVHPRRSIGGLTAENDVLKRGFRSPGARPRITTNSPHIRPMTETSATPNLERRLDVAVPLADIDGEVNRRLANLAKTVPFHLFGQFFDWLQRTQSFGIFVVRIGPAGKRELPPDDRLVGAARRLHLLQQVVIDERPLLD